MNENIGTKKIKQEFEKFPRQISDTCNSSKYHNKAFLS